MMRRLSLSLPLCLLLLAGVIHSASSRSATQSDTAYQVVQLVNTLRAAQGLPPLHINSSLMLSAQNQANYMAVNTIFSSHIGDGGSTPQSRANAAGYVGYVSENIVGGTGMTPDQGLIWWENSPVHFNTLVTTRYIEAGAGYATNGSVNFYVLVVGRPSDAPPLNTSRDDSPAPLFITPIKLAEPGEDGSIVHVVLEGQALWSLAAYYEVNIADLLLYNNLPENAVLHPGDAVIIRLAEGQEPPPTPTPPLTHIVRQGDTAWSIAAAYGAKLADFLWFNALGGDAILRPGEEVIVRLAEGQAPPPTPTPITTHIVRSGQTLWDIAFTYDLSLDDLLAYNGLNTDAILQVGQELRVRPLPTPTLPPVNTPNPLPTPSRSTSSIMAAQGAPTTVSTSLPPSLTPTRQIDLTPAATAVSNPTPSLAATGVTTFAIGLIVIAGIIFVFARREGS